MCQVITRSKTITSNRPFLLYQDTNITMPPSIRSFNPATDIPNMSGKVIFVTGGTNGIGYQTIIAMIPHGPEYIYFTGRNQTAADRLITKGKELNPKVTLEFIQMNMNSLSVVKKAMQSFHHNHLDILICLAGINSSERVLSQDCYEIDFAVNHLANALVFKHLLPILERTAAEPNSDVRFLTTSSALWRVTPSGYIAFDTLKSTQDGFAATYKTYGQSKLANLVYAREISKRYPSIKSVSYHPGLVKTDLVMNGPASLMSRLLSWIPGSVLEPLEGAFNALWLSTVARRDELVDGAFYYPIGDLKTTLPDEVLDDLGDKLWKLTERVINEVV